VREVTYRRLNALKPSVTIRGEGRFNGEYSAQAFADTPGIWTGTLFIGQFLTPIVLGAAAAATGSLSLALGGLGIACAVAVLTVLVRGPRMVPVSR
jgi:hypothetical protein